MSIENNQPAISVILPTLNRPDFLREALNSLVLQTFRDFEVIVVNDFGCSISEIAKSFASLLPALAVLEHSENRGLPASRNTALQASRGRWIAFLDDDDRFLPEHLMQLSQGAKSNPNSVCYSNNLEVWGNMESGIWVETSRTEKQIELFDKQRILLENFAPINCCLAPRSEIFKVGLFDESLSALEDWDLWIRLSQQLEFVPVGGFSCEVRRIQNSHSMTLAHSHGYAWASLNIIYKCLALTLDSPNLQVHYRNKVAEALTHLQALVLQSIGNHANLNGIFGRHSISFVIERLIVLENIYHSHPGEFCLLRSILHLSQGNIALARTELQKAVEQDPGNQTAHELFAIFSELSA